MKILKFLVFLIALLLVVFIVKGLMTPTLSYSSEIVVNKPVEEAWAVMNDESKVTEWLTSIKKMEHVSGTKGEVGAVTKYTFVDNGQESVVMETMKTIKPNEQVAMDFVVEGAMKMDYKMDLTEKDGKTYIKSSTITEGEGMIMKSILSFMKGAMQSQEDENMGRLKTVIEKNTQNYLAQPFPMEVQ